MARARHGRFEFGSGLLREVQGGSMVHFTSTRKGPLGAEEEVDI